MSSLAVKALAPIRRVIGDLARIVAGDTPALIVSPGTRFSRKQGERRFARLDETCLRSQENLRAIC
jgi:hypothetical protein